MLRWTPYTFVRTVLFFIAGILAGMHRPDLLSLKTCLLCAGVLTLAYFSVVIIARRARLSLNPGWLALALVALLGYVNVVQQTESRNPHHLINHHAAVTRYQAVVTRFPEEKAHAWKVTAEVLRVRDTTWKARNAKVILYFPKHAFPRPFRYGDVLLIEGQPDTLDAPANPGEFNYKAFLAAKNIYHQHFVREGKVIKTGYAPPNRFVAFAFRSREWAEAVLEKFIHGEREVAIASALVLGVTDGLDNELTNAYAATGTMHILAVSGLHVSILYFILLSIFKPLNRCRGGRWLAALAALTALWLYAFITGLSPSVLRAVTMFSFLALGRPAARSTNIYNTLAVSACCLLLYDPFLIRSVGFQLSYLAVLGIVYLYPRIVVLWEPQHAFTTRVWKLCAVSAAAQVATFPLSLLYFHQFPNYFLLSNLLVVPLSSAVLIGGLSLVVLGFATPVATVLGYCLEMTIRLLNGAVFVMEGLPFSLTENIYITPAQCMLLMLFIIAVLALTRYRKFGFVLVAAGLVVSYATVQWWHFQDAINVRRITVYKIPGHNAIDFFDRGKAFLVADSALRHDPQKIRYHVTPNRLSAGATEAEADTLPSRSFDGCRLIVWNGKTLLVIDRPDFRIPGALAVDWLIISNNAVADVDRIAGRVRCQRVILDSSNSFFFASRFLKAAKLHNLDVHSVLHEGAFISEIKKHDT